MGLLQSRSELGLSLPNGSRGARLIETRLHH